MFIKLKDYNNEEPHSCGASAPSFAEVFAQLLVQIKKEIFII